MKKCLLIFALFAGLATRAQEIQLTVIANQVGAPANLNAGELVAIFMGNKPTWANGEKVQLALMKTSTAQGLATCSKVFHTDADNMKKYWLTTSFSGKTAPVFFNTAAEIKEFLVNNRGAIGILEATEPSPGTRTVLIDGKKSF